MIESIFWLCVLGFSIHSALSSYAAGNLHATAFHLTAVVVATIQIAKLSNE